MMDTNQMQVFTFSSTLTFQKLDQRNACLLFEGVCLTHVSLTAWHMEVGVRATVLDTTSGDVGGKSQEDCSCPQAPLPFSSEYDV